MESATRNNRAAEPTTHRAYQDHARYDNLNRPLGKAYNDGVTPGVAWIWDTAKVGRLSSVESGISKTMFTYDAAGRILSSVQRTDGVDYDFHYGYHKGWGLKQVQYPSDRWVRYTPDVAGRVAKVERLNSAETVDRTYWQGVQYAPQGAPKQITLGNGLTERWQYNLTRQQPYDVRLGTAGNEMSHLALQFAYCANQYSGGSCTTNNGNIVAQFNYANYHIEHYGYL